MKRIILLIVFVLALSVSAWGQSTNRIILHSGATGAANGERPFGLSWNGGTITVSGTFTGLNAVAEISPDGSTFNTVSVTNLNGLTQSAAITAAGVYFMPIGRAYQFGVRVTAVTGTAVVVITPTDQVLAKGGGGAPSDATYITQTPSSTLTAEQALSALATGLLKNTTTTGVLSIAGASDLPTGIDAAKLADGSVSNAEFQRLDGVTSGIQTQIDGKQAALGFTPENVANKSTDGTLAGNSDTLYASQKATKTYADTKVSSVGVTSPITSTGGTSPTIACATCLVNGGSLFTLNTSSSGLTVPGAVVQGATFNVGASTDAVVFGSLKASATGGSGYVELVNQASAPGTPTSASRLFIDSSNRLSWKGTNGFVRTFDGTANTADRAYILPDAAGTLLLTTGSGAGLSGIVTSITGTANQVTASASTGAVTLSTPQNIHTAATPQFAGAGFGVASGASGLTVQIANGTPGLTQQISAVTAKSAMQASNVSGDLIVNYTSNLNVDSGLNAQRYDTSKIGLSLSIDPRSSVDAIKAQRISAGGVTTFPFSFFTSTGVLNILSGGSYCLSSSSTDAVSNAGDTCINRISAGLFGIGTSSGGGFAGSLKLTTLNAVTSIQIGGNALFLSTAPTISSGFGVTPAIAGIASVFKVTVGTGGDTSGVVAFNGTFANAPACMANDETSNVLVRAVSSTTGVTISGVMAGGDVIKIICAGY